MSMKYHSVRREAPTHVQPGTPALAPIPTTTIREARAERELLLLGWGCLVHFSRVLKLSLETAPNHSQDDRNSHDIQIVGPGLREIGLSKPGVSLQEVSQLTDTLLC